MSGAGPSGERPGKRARVEGEAVATPPQATGVFDALPDAVMSDVFKQLGLRESWPLRGVCRRWRRVVEETEWASFELTGAAASGEQSGESVYEAASALFEKRTLRLGGGASVTLRPQLAECADPDIGTVGGNVNSEQQVSAAVKSHRHSVSAVCKLLGAIARSHGGSGQLREVVVELREPEYVVADLVGVGTVSLLTIHFLREYLLGVLEALRPLGGTASGLEGLSIGLTRREHAHGRPPPQNSSWIEWPDAAELRAALAPFGALRSLALSFNIVDEGVGPEAAAAIAVACPLLRSVSLRPRPDSIPAVVAAFAPLARLQRLVAMLDEAVLGPDFTAHRGAWDGLGTLADGAAGRSLRSFAFVRMLGLFEQGRFPELSEGRRGMRFLAIPEAALAALARMPNIESVEPLRFGGIRGANFERIAALGRVASLRDVSVHLDFGREAVGEAADLLRATAEALAGLPRLRLKLTLSTFRTPAEHVARFLESAAVRRALVELSLSDFRPPEEAVARALAALPALRRLRLHALIGPDEPLGPFEVLRDLLLVPRPEVRVELELASVLVDVPLDEDREAELSARLEEREAAILALFQGPASL
eukprot:tig00020553_g10553.t1